MSFTGEIESTQSQIEVNKLTGNNNFHFLSRVSLLDLVCLRSIVAAQEFDCEITLHNVILVKCTRIMEHMAECNSKLIVRRNARPELFNQYR